MSYGVLGACDGPEHVWEEVHLTPGCDLHREHDGLLCTACYQTVDFVWSKDPRGLPDA